MPSAEDEAATRALAMSESDYCRACVLQAVSRHLNTPAKQASALPMLMQRFIAQFVVPAALLERAPRVAKSSAKKWGKLVQGIADEDEAGHGAL